jgi:hypothetical protein
VQWIRNDGSYQQSLVRSLAVAHFKLSAVLSLILYANFATFSKDLFGIQSQYNLNEPVEIWNSGASHLHVFTTKEE